ncbi:hypothetical protein IWX81_000301 [Salinibacterium sp. CAN_S4]|uniref:hypothetical protein n=1 Tax=Salinibacterium sp. CAN_S4 TaxID=2787727 RepID=UPI0018EFBFAE
MNRGTDYAPLTAPVTSAEMSAFRSSDRARQQYSAVPFVIQGVILAMFFVVFGVIAATVLSTLARVLFFSSPRSGPGDLATVVPFPVIVAGIVGTIVVSAVLVVRRANGRYWEKLFRMDGFASANGMIFSPRDPEPRYPGAIFSNGRNRESRDHLRSVTSRFLDYGNYRYVTGGGKNQSTHNWGFLALQLDRALPHMVLDSRANNGLFGGTNLPASFQKEQVLSLEGDFDNYFTLYCPRQYERDALYVFTPDLMALLIDNAAPFDVEIIDSWMFVYSAAPFDMMQPAVHERLLRIVDTVGAKTLSQTDRYADARIQDARANVVAPAGQRLKLKFPLSAVIVIGIFVTAFAVIPFITAALSR